MYILAGFLAFGLLANAMVRPLEKKWFMPADEVAALQASGQAAIVETGSFNIGRGQFDLAAALAWAAVGVPIAWGVWTTAQNVAKLFG
jgi:hypothetical protein